MEFTGQEYRTIKAALDGIPYEQVGPAYLYDSKVALKAIYAPRERRNGTSDDLTAARIRREEAKVINACIIIKPSSDASPPSNPR